MKALKNNANQYYLGKISEEKKLKKDSKNTVISKYIFRKEFYQIKLKAGIKRKVKCDEKISMIVDYFVSCVNFAA